MPINLFAVKYNEAVKLSVQGTLFECTIARKFPVCACFARCCFILRGGGPGGVKACWDVSCVGRCPRYTVVSRLFFVDAFYGRWFLSYSTRIERGLLRNYHGTRHWQGLMGDLAASRGLFSASDDDTFRVTDTLHICG